MNKKEILNKLISVVSEETKISVEEIKGKQRTNEISFARNIFCYMATNIFGFPLLTIAKLLNRDHTTIMHSRDKIKIELETNKQLKTIARIIYDKMKNLSNTKIQYGTTIYEQKNILTEFELIFFKKLYNIYKDKYIIQCQISLSDIIEKITFNREEHYQKELYKKIDFGIFSKEMKPLVMIELNDRTHNKFDTMKRDNFVEKILNNANIPLIKFYSSYPNEESYIKERIDKIIYGVKNYLWINKLLII